MMSADDSRSLPRDSEAENALKVDDLAVTTSDGRMVVVDDVSFTVASGQVLGLVGESGSGKTTIALALLGHVRRGLRIASGRVQLGGRDVLAMSPSDLRHLRGLEISYVPQDPASALNPVHRVGAQVEEALRVHQSAAEDLPARVNELLRDVDITPSKEILRRYPHQLSGGQQQRIALAIAFACRPSMIVLDEPTTGLDVTIQRHVLETVRRLCFSYGAGAVYVSHDLAVVSELATNVGVVYGGRIVELGDSHRTFTAPVHPYTRGLLDSIPSPRRSEVLRGINGQPPRIGHRPVGCAFEPRCEARIDACSLRPPDPVQVDGRIVRCIRADEMLVRNIRRRPERARTLPSGQLKLAVRDLCGFYGEREVLSSVNLEIRQQQCLAVVGESGAGKTTLAQCIAGLNHNWTGQVSLDGKVLKPDPRARDLDLLRRIQYIFQNPYVALNPRKTIGQIVSKPVRHFFQLSRADADQEVLSVLEDVSLGPDYLNRYPDELSGGERQRVAIARALVAKPELLICDEVTSSLDVSVQAAIVEMLRRLQVEHDLSMIFITHNLALMRSIAQKCIVLSEGRVVEAGTVTDILERPTDPYTIRLISDMPAMPTDLAELPE